MLEFLKHLNNIEAFFLFFIENTSIVLLVVILGYWIQKKFSKKDKLKFKLSGEEILSALQSTIINSLITFIGFWMWRLNYINFNENLSFEFILDLSFLLLIMDFIMYLLHWLIHKTRLYKPIHGLHHEYTKPNPIDLFVLSPLEAIAFGSLWLIVIYFYDANIYAVVAYLILNVFFGMIGHLSIEPFPKNWLRIPFLKNIGTSTFHYLHHTEKDYNFGFYTIIWDKMFNTLSPNYESAFKQMEDEQ